MREQKQTLRTNPVEGTRWDDLTVWTYHRRALEAAKKATEALAVAGIPSLPVKGVVLARQIYSDVVQRPAHDVDLLVKPQHFLRSIRVARQNEWRLVWDSKIIGAVNFIVDGVPIDLASFVGPPGTSALGVGDFLARSTLVEEPLGFPHLQIDLHDHVLSMALDAFKDKLSMKPWAREDLVRLADLPSFRPESLLSRAHEAKLETLLFIVAEWVTGASPSARWEMMLSHLRGRIARPCYVRAHRRCQQGPPNGTRLRILSRMASDSRFNQALALALGGIGTAMFVGRRHLSSR